MRMTKQHDRLPCGGCFLPGLQPLLASRCQHLQDRRGRFFDRTARDIDGDPFAAGVEAARPLDLALPPFPFRIFGLRALPPPPPPPDPAPPPPPPLPPHTHPP